MTEVEYCLDTLYKSKSNFRWAFWTLSEQQKQALATVYSFAHRVDSCADDINEPDVAQKQLEFWVKELDTLFKDNSTPLHPITKSLALFHQKTPWPKAPFYQLIDAMIFDVHQNTIENQSALDSYCYKVASTIGELIFHILQPNKTYYKEISYEAGLYMQKINILRDIGEDLRRGRIYIPQSILKEQGLNGSLNGIDSEGLEVIFKVFKKQIDNHAQQIAHLTQKESLPTFMNIILLTYKRLFIEISKNFSKLLTHKVQLGGLSKVIIAKEVLCHKFLKSPLLAAV